MAEVDFSDFESANVWFHKQRLETRHVISSRAALRVLANIRPDKSREHELVFLPCLRSIITSAGRGSGHPTDVDWDGANSVTRSASRHAALSTSKFASNYFANFPTNSSRVTLYSIVNSARSADLSAANSAANSMISARISASLSVVGSALNLAARSDSGSKEPLIKTLATIPIWNNVDIPLHTLNNHEDLLNFFDTDKKWAFWKSWYEAMWNGEFTDWELAFEVIKIADDVWDAGPEAVASEIERIRTEHFLQQHPLAEAIDINPDTGRFFSTPIPMQNSPLTGALLSQVQDSLEDATLGNNGLNAASRETSVLTRTFTRYANDPQRIEMDFTSVAVGLRRQIHETGELPNSEDNLALLASVEDGVRGIRAAHPDVAENRLILAQQTMRELPQDKIELLEDALPMLVAMSEDVMAEDFAADIPSLINDALLPLPNGAPPLPGADASTRIFNRVSHMRLMYDRFVEVGSKAFDSKAFKTARFGFTVVSMLSALVSLGLFLFGVI